MGASDLGAKIALEGAVANDYWLGIALAVSDAGVVTEADSAYLSTPRVAIPGGVGTGWNAASLRSITALSPTVHGSAVQDFTPAFWVLWSAASGGTACFWRRVNDDIARAGDVVSVPAETIRLIYPRPNENV